MSSYLWDSAESDQTIHDIALRGAAIALETEGVKSYPDLLTILVDGRIQQAFSYTTRANFIVQKVMHDIFRHDALDNLVVIHPTRYNNIWYLLFSYLEHRRWNFERAPILGALGGVLSLGIVEEIKMGSNVFQLETLKRLGLFE